MCFLGSLRDIVYIVLKNILLTLLIFEALRASKGPRTAKRVYCVNYSRRARGIISDNLCLYFNPVLVFCFV